MGNETEKGLTASAFAGLHDISRSMLLYYDRIGLFSPALKGENGYRYYTYRQSQTLEMILTLRELNMSIEEIRAYMSNPSEEKLLNMFDEKIRDVDRSIRRLREIKKLLQNREKLLREMEKQDFDRIDLVQCREEYLLVSPVKNEWTLENEVLSVTEHARKYHKYRIYNHSFGTMLSEEALRSGRFEAYSGYYTKVERPHRKDRMFLKPAGTYLRAFSVGNWDRLPATYERILNYAGERQIELQGYAYEEGMNELSVKNEEEYVTRILIRVEERKKLV